MAKCKSGEYFFGLTYDDGHKEWATQLPIFEESKAVKIASNMGMFGPLTGIKTVTVLDRENRIIFRTDGIKELPK